MQFDGLTYFIFAMAGLLVVFGIGMMLFAKPRDRAMMAIVPAIGAAFFVVGGLISAHTNSINSRKVSDLKHEGFNLTNANVNAKTVNFFAGDCQLTYSLKHIAGNYQLYNGKKIITPAREQAVLADCAS